MFNVITQLQILKENDVLVLKGTWLHKGELYDFDFPCIPGDVFLSLADHITPPIQGSLV